MEINNIEKPLVDVSASRGSRNAAPPPPPRRDTVKENTDPNRPTAARRPPALANLVTQGLHQAGVETSTTNAVQGAKATRDAQTENNLETSQSEKVAQALQAFMHSLVQAMNTKNEDDGAKTASVALAAPVDSNPESQALPSKAADAYGGLVSRLEGLARKLEGADSASIGNNGLDQLNAAFEDLASATAENGRSRESEAPKLQTVLQNMIRNLQSTGDPTLASTGNVINTAA